LTTSESYNSWQYNPTPKSLSGRGHMLGSGLERNSSISSKSSGSFPEEESKGEGKGEGKGESKGESKGEVKGKRMIPNSKSSSEPPFFQTDEGGLRATIVEGPGLYFMGIIDILQEYNTKKN